MKSLKPHKGIKQLPVDAFAAKYNKLGNKFYQPEVKKPIQDPDTKRTHFIKVNLQLVIQKDNKLVAREI